MAKDFKEIIAQVKLAYTLSDYVRNSGVQLKHTNATWIGLCPFHNEKTGSFNVSDQFGRYHCFGCGEAGDLITYVMKTEHLEFVDALKKLGEDKGIDVDISGEGDSSIDFRALRECMRESANFYVQNYRKLPKDHLARQQVISRGVSERGMIYGYAPDNRTALYRHLKSLGMRDEIMIQAGVIRQNEKTKKISDFFSSRLMFIITDTSGKPIGFSSRKLRDEDFGGKYVNSPAGPLFDKSVALFNIQNARKTAPKLGEVYVAEGQFDVAAFMEAGAENVVATSGTALTAQHGMNLHRLVGEGGKIIFAFDGDKAGINAAKKVFEKVPSVHSNAWVILFPEGMDPCDYRLEKGNEALQQKMLERVPLVEFILDIARDEHDMGSELGRATYLNYAASVLKTISSNTVREQFIRKVALDSFVEVSAVKSAVERAKPLESRTPESDSESVEISTPVLEPEESTVDLMQKIKENKVYALAARFIALAVQRPELRQYLPKNKAKLPPEFGTTIDEILNLTNEAAVIPEAFTDSALIEALSNPRLFPLIHLEQFDAHEQFEYIFKQYMNSARYVQEEEIQHRIYGILTSSDDNQIELLRNALKAEETLLKEIKIGS